MPRACVRRRQRRGAGRQARRQGREARRRARAAPAAQAQAGRPLAIHRRPAAGRGSPEKRSAAFARRRRAPPAAAGSGHFALPLPEGHAKGGTMSAEKRLKELGITLGPVTPPVANYVNAVRTGNLLYLAGKGPASGVTGIVGKDMTAEQAYGHART